MAEPLPYQRVVYGLLAPQAVLGLLVWFFPSAQAAMLAAAFGGLSLATTIVLPGRAGAIPFFARRNLLAMVLAVAAAAVLSVQPQWLEVCTFALAAAALIRLQYQRQLFRREGDTRAVELMRRGILISLWSHISVLVVLLNPFQW